MKAITELYPYQEETVTRLKSGSILWAGVGSGKSRTSLAFYYSVICQGTLDDSPGMKTPRDLYIITTAKKRDNLEWEQECSAFRLAVNDRSLSIANVLVVIDSWNNIKKYVDIENSFFIFDEQRLVGSGVWAKSFLKICKKKNDWVLLTATPGDTWMDYIPAFIANGFYRTRTEFIRRHVVYNSFTRFPKIERYVETSRLERLKRQIVVYMEYKKPTRSSHIDMNVGFDLSKLSIVIKKRWDPYKNKPIREYTSLLYLMRRVVNEHPSRKKVINEILDTHNKAIIFYNFNYELDILRTLDIKLAEYNGHKHQAIPKGDRWAYLVQYTSGAEGWNCVETDTVIFYSLNYSYKMMIQAAGRIDRLNTSFTDLYYYYLKSRSSIDQAIEKTLKRKRNFNQKKFITDLERRNYE